MKIYRNIFYIIVSSFLFLSVANGQPAKGNSSGAAEKYVDLDKINSNHPTVYELRCRGINPGGTLLFQTVGSRTHSSGAEIRILELSFSPSLEAAGVNSAGLQPGECSWIDRPLSGLHRTGEPWRIRFETPANAQLKQMQSGSKVDKSPNAAESYPDAITIPNYLTSPNHYWSFKVFNTGKGYFQAQSHQHWKKILRDKMLPGGIVNK